MARAKAKPVTVRYENGTAAIFGTVDEALAQAAHDRSYPGHVSPALIVDGDHSETHSLWMLDRKGIPQAEVDVLHDGKAMRGIECQCMLCDFHRRTVGKNINSQERGELWDYLFGMKHPDDVQYKLPPIAGGAVPGAGFAVTSTAVALAAATTKSVIGVIAGSNVPPDFIELAGGGDGASGNVLIDIVHGTNATAGTSTAFTAVQTRGPVQTPTATTSITYTVEPTVLTVTRRWRFPWPGGPWLMQFPLGREPNAVITASTIGKYLGLRATSTVAVTNSDWYLEIEE